MIYEMKSCNKDATDLRERTKAFAISVITGNRPVEWLFIVPSPLVDPKRA